MTAGLAAPAVRRDPPDLVAAGVRLPHPRHPLLRARRLLHLLLSLRGPLRPRRARDHHAGGHGRHRLPLPAQVGAAGEPTDMDGRRNSG